MAIGFAQWGNNLYTGKKSYDVVGKRKRFYAVSIVLVVAFLALIFGKGFNLGIDFEGGSEFLITNTQAQSQQKAIDTIAAEGFEEVPRVSTLGGSGVRVQMLALDPDQRVELRAALADAYNVGDADISASSVGPTWGADVSKKAIQGLIVFLLLVTVVMTIYFRNWRMALAALLALFHDLIITVGIYAAVGWEVTPATMIGFLTILGYSIYDTVVVFDKVRENTAGILTQTDNLYSERANLAVNQTMVRSINTSVVALLPVGSILFIGSFLLGAGTLRDIALSLFVGMAVGTYSSIFLATPLEVSMRERVEEIAEHTTRVLAERERRGVVATSTEGQLAAAGLTTEQIREPGRHQGMQAQPKRKRR